MSALRQPPRVEPPAPLAAETPAARLVRRLETDPGRFEPSTAFRVATGDGTVRVTSTFGVMPAAVAVALTAGGAGPRTLVTPVAGLVGPLGVLPPSYNEMVMREQRHRSHALLAFLDVFGQRIAELFFDACEKYRLARRLRWGGRGAGNGFLRTLFSLTGFGTRGLQESAGVDTDVLLRFSGFFAQRTRNAASLRALLQEFTGVPVTVEQFRARWLAVEPGDRTALDGTARLGVDAMAGAAIEDRSSAFRIVLGPLGYADYQAYAPGQPDAAALIAVTRLFVGSGLAFDVQVVLRKDDIPFCRLGGTATPAPRLGWNSWARIAPAERDSGDAFYPASAGESAVPHVA